MVAFNVEAFAGCPTDFVEIQDGMDPDSPLLGKFCGKNIGSDIPTSIQSTQQNLRISFRSNYYANGQGFALEYETANCAGDVNNRGKAYFKCLSIEVLIKLPQLFAECCRWVLVQYKDNDTSVHGLRHYLYTVYEIEPDLVNERVHYTSLDGKYAIAFDECGDWDIQGEEDRYI